MQLRTLVAVFSADNPDGLARQAAVVARQNDAHLTGLFVIQDPAYYPMISGYMTEEFVAEIRTRQQREVDVVRRVFEEAAAAEGVAAEWRGIHQGTRTVAEQILDTGRGADLVLMPRASATPPHVQTALEHVIRDLGRPVLLLPPKIDLPVLPKRALVGWSPTREAARAAFDALLLLAPEAQLTLLHVGPVAAHELADGPMNDLARALSRHEVEVTVTHREARTTSVAAVLETEAREVGAGFVATGAFGHSRAYDFVIGAVSLELLKTCTLPMLMAK
ncbi:universal stress protein [Roseivivax sp. CAU 1761]